MSYRLLVMLSLVPTLSLAALEPMSDEAMAELSGQALIKISEYVSEAGQKYASDPTKYAHYKDQKDISFTRVDLGLKLELNANIEELLLGRYHREPGNKCHDGGRFCDNTEADKAPFNQWNCSVSICGGINKHGVNGKYDNDKDFSPFQASALVYGEFFGFTEDQKGEAAASSAAQGEGTVPGLLRGLLGVTPSAYTNAQDFNNSEFFPSGFNITRDTDARLRDVSLGRVVHVDENGVQKFKADGTPDTNLNTHRKLEPFVLDKPFVEFAYDGTGVDRKVAGLRIGYGSATGTQGNAIDVLSGFVQPVITAKASGDISVIGIRVSGKATYEFSPYLGGVRTPGYLDPSKSLPGQCTAEGRLGDRFCEQTATGGSLAHTAPQAQLFPLQNVQLTDSPTFWFSLQSKPVNYNNDKSLTSDNDVREIEYEQAQPGLWVNLGAYKLIRSDGSAVPFSTTVRNTTDNALPLDLLRKASGFHASVLKPAHPDNYFSAHANSTNYPQANNYY